MIGLDPVGVLPGGLEHRARELEPGHRALVGDVEEPGPALDDEPADHRGGVGGERGVAALVVDERAACRARPARRRIVFTMLLPWQPHTHDDAHDRRVRRAPRSSCSPASFDAPVDRLRVRRVPLDVGLGLRAVEHVVGRERSTTCAPTRRAASATWRVPSALTAKARSGSLSHASTAVHAAACTIASGRVDVTAASTASRSVTSSCGVVGRDHLVVGERADELVADLAAGAGDEDAHGVSASAAASAAPTTSGCRGTRRRWPRAPRGTRAAAPSRARATLSVVDRVAPVVAEAVLDVLDHRVVVPEDLEDRVGELAVRAPRCRRRCCRSRRPRPARSTRSTPAQLSST